MARKKVERSDDNLDKLIQEYYNLDTQIKELSDRKDPLNKTIKLAMRKRGITKYLTGNLAAICSIQRRIKYFDEPAVKRLKSLGFNQAVKEIVDPETIKDLIKTGQINEEVLVDYMEVKEIELLTIKKE